MTIQEFELRLITENPWNERELDQANVDTIALSIRADGLLQPPLGRWADGGAEPGVQLAFGHHRLAAYRKLQMAYAKGGDFDSLPDTPGQQNPWSKISVDVRDINDRTMARYAIVENHHRSDPSAIERARALLRLTGELGMTQAEAGALFGLKSQASVAHLTSLLRLPEDVQKLIHTGEISQGAAKALLPLMHFDEKAVSKIAKDSLDESAEERTEAIQGEIRNLLDRKAQSLAVWGRPWPLDWPGKPMAIDDNRKEKGEPSEIPACLGCKFAVIKDPKADPQARLSFCLRKPCFDAKGRAWARQEVARVAERLGISVATPGETVSVVFAGSYYNADQQRATKLIRAKLPGLRLAPHKGTDTQGLQDVFGSKSVMLVTTDNLAVTKYLNESKGKPAGAPVKSANETPAQAERRRVAEQEQREERALDRMAYNRSKADVLWLVEHTAQLIAERTAGGAGLLVYAISEQNSGFYSGTEEMRLATDALADKTGVDKLGHGYGNGKSGWKDALATSSPEMDKQRRQYLAYRKITREVASGKNATDVYGDLARARKTCESVAVETFGISLPAGWDQAPIHRTPINCWECGRFSPAGTGKLTQSDLKEGWVTKPDGSVRCPEHRAPNLVETLTADGPAKPTLVVKKFTGKLPKKPTVAQAATAAAVALASKPNVHGHSRPAPKPSAAKKAARRKVARKGK